LDIVEIPTVVLLCLFQGLVAGLLRPRPFLEQIEQSSKKQKVPGAPQYPYKDEKVNSREKKFSVSVCC